MGEVTNAENVAVSVSPGNSAPALALAARPGVTEGDLLRDAERVVVALRVPVRVWERVRVGERDAEGKALAVTDAVEPGAGPLGLALAVRVRLALAKTDGDAGAEGVPATDARLAERVAVRVAVRVRVRVALAVIDGAEPTLAVALGVGAL